MPGVGTSETGSWRVKRPIYTCPVCGSQDLEIVVLERWIVEQPVLTRLVVGEKEVVVPTYERGIPFDEPHWESILCRLCGWTIGAKGGGEAVAEWIIDQGLRAKERTEGEDHG